MIEHHVMRMAERYEQNQRIMRAWKVALAAIIGPMIYRAVDMRGVVVSADGVETASDVIVVRRK